MAKGEAITTIEERAAAIRAEADMKRERVPESLRASNDAVLNETFERAVPTATAATAAEQPASALEASILPASGQQASTPTDTPVIGQQESAPEANTSPTTNTQRSQAPSAAADASPSPATNADEFEDGEVSAVHDKAKDIERQTFFKQQAAEDNPNKTGAMVQGAFAARLTETAEAKKKKEEAERFKQLMKMLDDYIGWLDEQIAYWQEQHEQWTERADAVADAIARLDRGETIEVDEDGLPTDQRLREAVEAYEQKYGRRLDVNNRDDLVRLHVFTQEQRDYARDQIDRYERDRQRAQDLKEDLERNPNDPATIRRVEEELQHAQGQMRVAEASARSESAAVKETVHAQAARTEQAQEIAAQMPTAERFFAGTDDAFEDDGFGGGTSFAKTADPDHEALPGLRPTFQVAAIGEAAPAPDDPAPDAAPLSIPSRTA